jgi:PAS domain S-box-containing protein
MISALLESQNYVAMSCLALAGGLLLALLLQIRRAHRVAARLAARETLQHGMMEGSLNAVLKLDEHGRCLVINENGPKLMGLSQASCTGKSFLDLWPPSTWPNLANKLEQARKGTRVTTEAEYTHSSGSKSVFRVVLSPLPRVNGCDERLAAVCMDITEQKRAEAMLTKAIADAQTATRSKDEFLANMSHEIRTPLTAILGFADLLADSQLPGEEQQNWLQTIRRNGQHLLSLINDILDLSKIDARKMTLSMSQCNISQVLCDVVEMMRFRAEERGVKLSLQSASPLPQTILADEVRLRQVLVNLVGNAVKFTEKGSVRVVATLLPSRKVGDSALKIDVIDTGPGMTPQQLQRLGEPFYQTDTSSSRRYPGTGLGLAITKRLIEIMQGELDIDSRLGQGSTFSVTVQTGPLDGVEMVAHHTQVPSPVPVHNRADRTLALKGLRVLLAEDGVDNQRLIGIILKNAGADVAVASNGRIAVELAHKQEFDVILMDMQMPEMDGYQATRHLRDTGNSCPIIALTAHAMSGDRQKCLDAGCTDYAAKPVDREVLVATVARWGRKTQSVAAAPAPGAQEAPTAGEQTPAAQAIRSHYADDPDLVGLVVEFARKLGGRLAAMRELLKANCLDELRMKAHQLKGAGSGYGYPDLTNLGKTLEQQVASGDVEGAGLTLAQLDATIAAIQNGLAVPDPQATTTT